MKFFFADVDGTFIVDREIPSVNIEAVKALESKGHRFILVSGRSVHQIEDVLEQGNFECDYIFGNGAGYKLMGEEPVLKYFIDKSEYDYWEGLFKDHDAFYTMHTSVGMIMHPLDVLKPHFDDLIDTYEQLYGIDLAMNFKDTWAITYAKNALHIEDPFDYLRKNPEVKLIKFEVLNGSEHTRLALKKHAQDFGYLAFSSIRINLEIVPSRSNKGSAIESYLTMFDGVQITFGFGDALNDLEMFDVVDVSVAAKDALDEIKSICDITLDEDIGHFIHNNI